jgi:hypothetical protein
MLNLLVPRKYSFWVDLKALVLISQRCCAYLHHFFSQRNLQPRLSYHIMLFLLDLTVHISTPTLLAISPQENISTMIIIVIATNSLLPTSTIAIVLIVRLLRYYPLLICTYVSFAVCMCTILIILILISPSSTSSSTSCFSLVYLRNLCNLSLTIFVAAEVKVYV